MFLYVEKAWFRKRWHVYAMGRTEGDRTWLATFRLEIDAKQWAGVE